MMIFKPFSPFTWRLIAPAMLGMVLLLSGCAIAQDQVAAPVQAYNSDSWRTEISQECVAFFDGCNQCRRAPDSDLVACTRKYCVSYQKPYCMPTKADDT